MTHIAPPDAIADSPPPQIASRDGRGGWLPWVAGLLILSLILALVASYLARRILAREALIGWLNARGVEADVSFETLGPSGLSGALRIGPAQAPVILAEKATLAYRLTGPWAGQRFGVELDEIVLVGPVIRVRWTPDGPSLGVLDPLIAEFRQRPLRPDTVAPDIIIRNGQLKLQHDSGLAEIQADAVMTDGVLVRLSGRLTPTRMSLGEVTLDLGEARLGLVTRDGTSSASLTARLNSGRLGAVSVGSGDVALALTTRYPSAISPLGTGPFSMAMSARSPGLVQDGVRLDDLAVSGRFQGQASGGLAQLTLRGKGVLRADVGSGAAAGFAFGEASGLARSTDFIWRQGVKAETAGDVQISIRGGNVQRDELTLSRVSVDLAGPVRQAGGALTADLTGPLSLAGSWRGLGPEDPGDIDTVAAVKRAAGAFTLTTPKAQLVFGEGGVRLGLPTRAQLVSPSGGQVILAARSGAPVFADGAGALDLRASGGGLPSLEAEVIRFRLGQDGLAADTRISIATDFGPLEGMEAQVSGVLRLGSGEVTYLATTCMPLAVSRFEAGETSLEAISLSLCPGSAPLFALQDGRWRITGRAEGAAALAQFLQAGMARGRADIVFGIESGTLFTRAQILSGQVMDRASSPRFNPLDVTGRVALDQGVWDGALQLSSGGAPVAEVRLDHDGADGLGSAQVDTGPLMFVEGGLQPSDLSPLARAIGSPARGSVRFAGSFQWSPQGPVSSGILTVPGLDFLSPAGPVRGLSGEISFTSLTPLETASGQQLRAQDLQLVTPLIAPRATFQLLGQSLEVNAGAADVGGGTVRLEPMSIPLDPGQSWRGELVVEGVQLADIVSATPFADRVSLSAKVSGRLPFVAGPDGIRFAQGRLEAIEPGRLSIRRAALTDISASGGVARPAPEGLGAELSEQAASTPPVVETNTAVEFAYQAMEHLAFDLLDAEVNSLPGGRLGVLFHIRGAHSPPERQEIRLTPGELIRRDFMNRPLPLPFGTEVDLTLDTSLNLDQLLADYADAQAVGGSGEVQTPEPE